MSTNRYTQVGIDRLVRLVWLEKTAALVLAGNRAQDLKAILQEDLQEAFVSSKAEVRGSLDKTITILMKVWLTVPAELSQLQAAGLELLKTTSEHKQLALHWGMLMAGYPFWAAVAAQSGRLLKLQGTVAAAQVQRRVREQYGERETVARRVRYVLRSFLDWGVLKETGEKGVYELGPALQLDEPQLIAWLIQALLQAKENGAATLRELTDSPSLFPFCLAPIQAETLVATTPGIEVLRQGMDEALIMLANHERKKM